MDISSTEFLNLLGYVKWKDHKLEQELKQRQNS